MLFVFDRSFGFKFLVSRLLFRVVFVQENKRLEVGFVFQVFFGFFLGDFKSVRFFLWYKILIELFLKEISMFIFFSGRGSQDYILIFFNFRFSCRLERYFSLGVRIFKRFEENTRRFDVVYRENVFGKDNLFVLILYEVQRFFQKFQEAFGWAGRFFFGFAVQFDVFYGFRFETFCLLVYVSSIRFQN